MNRYHFHKAIAILLLLTFAVGYNNNEKPNIFALLLNTSKFWFNYRQSTNTLQIYKYLKEHGVPDENILLFMPDSIACNSRNNVPGTISCNDMETEPNLYTDLEVDFKYAEVTSRNWLDTIRKRYLPDLPYRRRLRSNDNSIIFVYMTGHGGDGYHKVQDTDIMMDFDFGLAIKEAAGKRSYRDMFLFSDSCGAFTIFDEVKNDTSPNIVMLGSSSVGEKSYSYGKCHIVEVSKTDQFTRTTLEHLNVSANINFDSLINSYDPVALKSHPGIKHTYPKRNLRDMNIADFMTTEFRADFSGLSFESVSAQELNSLAGLAAILAN